MIVPADIAALVVVAVVVSWRWLSFDSSGKRAVVRPVGRSVGWSVSQRPRCVHDMSPAGRAGWAGVPLAKSIAQIDH